MFQWFSNLLLRRRVAGRRSNLIFRYFDGRQLVGVDPCSTFRKLTALQPNGWDWAKTPKAIDPPEDEEGQPIEMTPALLARQADAIDKTLAVIRDVFEVTPYDHTKQTGLTDAETLGLLVQFGNYLATVKKNGSTWQTSRPASGVRSSPKPSDPTPNADSVSGSTCDEPKPADPSESSLASPPPLEPSLP
jgi:hypothetical protein